jgi:hypothetical protein
MMTAPAQDEPAPKQNLVLKLVLISAHLTAPKGTEAGPKPRFRLSLDLTL